MAPRPGRILREFRLPFAERGARRAMPRAIKASPEFVRGARGDPVDDLGDGGADHGRGSGGGERGRRGSRLARARRRRVHPAEDGAVRRRQRRRLGADLVARRRGRCCSGSGRSPRPSAGSSPIFWPPLGAHLGPAGAARHRGLSQRAALGACRDQRLPGAVGGVLRRAGRHPARLRDGAVVGGARALRSDRRVHAADPAAGADPAGHPLVRHRRDREDRRCCSSPRSSS